MDAKILALSIAEPLPIPVGSERKVNGVEDGEDRESDLLGQSPRLLGSSPSKEPIAPYQALPVCAQTITEHITPALPVVDHSKLSKEVRCANVPSMLLGALPRCPQI